MSGDTGKDDYWERYDGETGTRTQLTAEPVIKDGRINVPAFAGDYDTFAPYAAKNALVCTNNLRRVFTVLAGATCTLDGLTVCGGGWGQQVISTTVDGLDVSYGTALYAAAGSTVTLRNSRFVGNNGYSSTVQFYSTSSKSSTVTVENVSFEFSRGCRYAAVCSSAYTLLSMSNCTFYGNVRQMHYPNDKYFGQEDGAAALFGQGYLKLRDCTFERNATLRTYVHQGKVSGSAAVLLLGGLKTLPSGEDNIANLKFVGNASFARYWAPMPLVNVSASGNTLKGCLFEGNVSLTKDEPSQTKYTDVNAATHAGLVFDSTSDVTLEDSTIVSNRMYASLYDKKTGYPYTRFDLAPVVARANVKLVGVTFLDNVVERDLPADCPSVASRAVLSLATSKSTAASVFAELRNCLSTGADPLPDLVSSGTNGQSVASRAVNSIFWATGAAAESPRAEVGLSGCGVELERCIVRAPELLASGVWESGFVEEEDPLLEPIGFLQADDLVPVIRCGARPPALTKGDNDGVPCLLGPVQETAADAKATVVVRARSGNLGLNFGKINGQSRALTFVMTPGTPSDAVTAAPNAGFTFGCWCNAAGKNLSDATTYAPTLPTEGSDYADALFLSAEGALIVDPGESIQDAIDLSEKLAFCKVRLNAGIHRIAEPLVTHSKFALLGDGNVILTGDTQDNGVWADAAGNTILRNGQPYRIFDGMTFNEPDPTEEDFYWKPVVPGNTTKIYDVYSTRADKGAGVTNTFEGITFACGRLDFGAAVTTMRNCRVLAVPAGLTTFVGHCYSNLVLTGTSFIGNLGCPMGTNKHGIRGKMNWTVSNCVFRLNVASGNDAYVSPALGSHSAAVDVYETEFSRNVNTRSEGGVSGALVYPFDKTRVRYFNCTIRDNFYSNGCALVRFPYSNTSGVISNCLFLANRMVATPGTGFENEGATALVMPYTGNGGYTASIYNTTFLSNSVSVSRTVHKDDQTNGFSCVVYAPAGIRLINSHFEGNFLRSTTTADDYVPHAATVCLCRDEQLPLLGNTFYNNDVTDGDIYLKRSATDKFCNFVNCILWNDDPAYVPVGWFDAGKDRANFYSCVVRNGSDADGVCTFESCGTTDPLFGPLAWREGRAYRPIGLGSARHTGAEFGATSAGTPVFVRKSDNKTYNVATMATKSMTLATHTGDMFGDLPKRLKCPDIGCVQNTAPQTGLVLTVW